MIFWDLFGEQGHPIRATVAEMGPLLLSRLLDLNEVQEGVLNVAFKIADDEGLPLLDFKDLRAILDAISPLEGKKAQAEGTGSVLLTRSSRSPLSTGMSQSSRSAPSSASCSCSRTRAARNSSANPRWT